MTDIDHSARDQLVSVARGIAGAIPFVGPMIAEVLTEIVPGQRLDRVVEFVKALDEEVRQLDARARHFESSLRSAEGLDLLEEGMVQAARAVSTERRQRLGRLVGRSLTADELAYAESRKLLNLYRELTDEEVVWLLYYSMNPVLGAGPHTEWVAQHPGVLQPVSRDMGAPREQHERGALQDSWKETLQRLGLTTKRGQTTHLTTLGRMLVKYISEEEPAED